MRKYENVDIIATLGTVMEINTAHYKSDFQYDIEMFQRAATAPDGENNRLLWLSRSSGTECFVERDAFIKGTYSHSTWCYHAGTKDSILAYAVEITGTENGWVKGNLYELDYWQHVDKLKRNALPASTVKISYEDGAEKQFTFDEYNNRNRKLIDAEYSHGSPSHIRVEPENGYALQERLNQAREERQKSTPAIFKARNMSRKPSLREQLAKNKADAAAVPKRTAAKNNVLEEQI